RQSERLLDYMRAAGEHLSRVKHAGGIFAWLRVAIPYGRARPTCQQRRTDRPLEINDRVIFNSAQLTQAHGHLLPGVERKEGAAPFRGVDGVDTVDQGTLRRARSGAWKAQSAEQFSPALFDEPS